MAPPPSLSPPPHRRLAPLLLATLALATTLLAVSASAHPTSSSSSDSAPRRLPLLSPRQEPAPAAAAAAAATDEPTCGFDGDQDTYGLGLRIGLYLQWVTSSVAYNCVAAEAVTMRGVNNCFQAAMFAGLIFVTVTRGQELYAVEAYLMLLFCMGGVCSGTAEPAGAGPVSLTRETRVEGRAEGGGGGDGGDGDGDEPAVTSRAGGGGGGGAGHALPPGALTDLSTLPTALHHSTSPTAKRFAFLQATTLGGYIRLLLGCGFVAYGLWFVFTGMDGMQHPPCARHAFFFARVDLFGWFRGLLKALFVLAALPAALQLGSASVALAMTARAIARGEYGRPVRRRDKLPSAEMSAFVDGERKIAEKWARADPMVAVREAEERERKRKLEGGAAAAAAAKSVFPTATTTATSSGFSSSSSSAAAAAAAAAGAGKDDSIGLADLHTRQRNDTAATLAVDPDASLSNTTNTKGALPPPHHQEPVYLDDDDGASLAPARPRNSLILNSNRGLSLALPIFMVATELTIRWNNISGVSDVGSTGQLLPVIIGVGGIGRVLFAYVRQEFMLQI